MYCNTDRTPLSKPHTNLYWGDQGFVCPVTSPVVFFRDDGGLNNSQAHMALNEHGSLFHETKEHLDGRSPILMSLGSLWLPLAALVHSSNTERHTEYSFHMVNVCISLQHSLFIILTCVCATTDHDSDSDSDLSLEDDQSGSYASTHSSDSEEEGPYPPDECWESMASNVSKRPHPQGMTSHL